MSNRSAQTIQYVIFPDTHTRNWIAQGLELDICVQAKTLEEVHEVFERTVAATANANVLEGKEPFDGISEAPTRFWEMCRAARKLPPLRPEKPQFDVNQHRTVKLVEHLVALAY